MISRTANAGSITLGELLEDMVTVDSRAGDIPIYGLSMDSRTLRTGDCFLACQGNSSHGARHIAQALAAGAVAVLFEADQADLDLPAFDAPVVLVPALAAKVGVLAARFYDHPSRAMKVIGITGTNGKTSVSHFIAQALNGHDSGPSGVIGTLGHGLIDRLQAQPLTTPDPVTLHRAMARLHDDGANTVVLEASSHGLAQHRLSGVEFDTAVFTNLSRDHLDYHGSMSSYARAKKRLFLTPGLRSAVINFDDPFAAELLHAIPHRVFVIGYSLQEGPLGLPMDAYPVLRANQIHSSARGIDMNVITAEGEMRLTSGLLGRFNAANLLAALGAVIANGMTPFDAIRRLAKVIGVPGRMEVFSTMPSYPTVVVDYAHTPDGLEQVLTSLRDPCKGRLVCVFGCGGERDSGKRPLMGEVAARLADRVIVTDDNPRREDPAAIVEQILVGGGGGRAAHVQVIRDRATAITTAINDSKAGDVVLVAGKGHEDYQDIGGHRLKFSDRGLVRRLVGGDRG